MKEYFGTFRFVLMSLLEKPVWLMLIVVVGILILAYAKPVLWELPIAVIDQDKSTASQRFIRAIDASPKMELRTYNDIHRAYDDMLDRKLFAVMIIPSKFEKKILAGKDSTIALYGDATNRLPNGQIQLEVSKAYSELLSHYNGLLLENAGFTSKQASVLLTPVKSEKVGMFNPGVSFAAIVLPGVLVMLLQHAMLIACVQVNVTLRSNPNSKPTVLIFLGAISALVPIFLFLATIFFSIVPWLLGYNQYANIAQVWIITFPFLVAVLGFGILFSQCLRNIELIYLTLSFVTIPVFYLTGTIWPLQAMPTWVYIIAASLPSTWATNAMTSVNQMGLPLIAVWPDMIKMLLLGLTYALFGGFISILRSGKIHEFKIRMPKITKRKK